MVSFRPSRAEDSDNGHLLALNRSAVEGVEPALHFQAPAIAHQQMAPKHAYAVSVHAPPSLRELCPPHHVHALGVERTGTVGWVHDYMVDHSGEDAPAPLHVCGFPLPPQSLLV